MVCRQLRQAVIGNPLDPATTFGSLSSLAHRSKIKHYVDLAVQEGVFLGLAA